MITRIFQNGNSQAIRIPQPYRLSDKEVDIQRDGSALIIRPLKDKPSMTRRYLGSFGSGDDRQDLHDLIEDDGIYYE